MENPGRSDLPKKKNLKIINGTNMKFCYSSEGSTKEACTRMFPESMLVTEKKRKNLIVRQ